MMRYIDVAAAAIVNGNGELLIAKRAPHRHQGDRWEFPGGKLEPGESAEQALSRELQEELGITPTRMRPLITIRHHYSDKAVCLHVFRVEAFTGVPHGHEGQPLAWVPAAVLHQYPFPAANLPIIAAVQLPDQLLITPEPSAPAPFLAAIERACQRGIRMVQLRAHRLPDADYRQLAQQVFAITESHACQLMLNRDPKVIADLSCAGWHLSGPQLRAFDQTAWPQRPHWLSASCHNSDELKLAEQQGVDYVLISPVQPTTSHPDAAVLGWAGFATLAAQANRPAFALGGMTAADRECSWQYGGQGIAAIRSLWPAVE